MNLLNDHQFQRQQTATISRAIDSWLPDDDWQLEIREIH